MINPFCYEYKLNFQKIDNKQATSRSVDTEPLECGAFIEGTTIGLGNTYMMPSGYSYDGEDAFLACIFMLIFQFR